MVEHEAKMEAKWVKLEVKLKQEKASENVNRGQVEAGKGIKKRPQKKVPCARLIPPKDWPRMVDLEKVRRLKESGSQT